MKTLGFGKEEIIILIEKYYQEEKEYFYHEPNTACQSVINFNFMWKIAAC
jgi:hypothetical protein